MRSTKGVREGRKWRKKQVDPVTGRVAAEGRPVTGYGKGGDQHRHAGGRKKSRGGHAGERKKSREK
jgi:hypothetical protein